MATETKKRAGRRTKSAVASTDAQTMAHELLALGLRQKGRSYRSIAEEMGVSHETARQCVKRAMDRLRPIVEERAEEVRELELSRLDIATNGLMPKVIEGDTYAIDKLVKVMDRRARLLGLDAPTKASGTLKAEDSETGRILTVTVDF